MKSVTMIETCDGLKHPNQERAERHLDALVGDLITRLAHKLVATDCKYVKITEVLDSTTEVMREIVRLKDDMKLVREDEE